MPTTPDHLIQEVMGRCRVQCSALHDLNLPVDAATENAISDFFRKIFTRFDDHWLRGISQMFLFLPETQTNQNSILKFQLCPLGD